MIPVQLKNRQIQARALFKDSPDPSHFIFENNVGKSRIRPCTTLNLDDAIFEFLLCRIRLFPTLISKIKWLGNELSLNKRPYLCIYRNYCPIHDQFHDQLSRIRCKSFCKSLHILLSSCNYCIALSPHHY